MNIRLRIFLTPALVNIVQPTKYGIPDSGVSEQIHKIWIKEKKRNFLFFIMFFFVAKSQNLKKKGWVIGPNQNQWPRLQKRKPRCCCSDFDDETLLLLWLGVTNSVVAAAEMSCWAWSEGEDGRKVKVKYQASFFFCEDEVAVHNDVLLCDVLFFYEELQLLGVGIEEWKVSDGKKTEIEEEKQKKKGWRGQRLV